jgi:hypothetical protein
MRPEARTLWLVRGRAWRWGVAAFFASDFPLDLRRGIFNFCRWKVDINGNPSTGQGEQGHDDTEYDPSEAVHAFLLDDDD